MKVICVKTYKNETKLNSDVKKNVYWIFLTFFWILVHHCLFKVVCLTKVSSHLCFYIILFFQFASSNNPPNASFSNIRINHVCEREKKEYNPCYVMLCAISYHLYNLKREKRP